MDKSVRQKNHIKEKASGWYLFLLFTVFPLAVYQGYTNILTIKTIVFFLFTGIYILAVVCDLIRTKDRKIRIFLQQDVSVTDYLILGFGMEVCLSWMFCLEKKAQFLGIYGRNMGLAAYLFCVLMFCFISRYLQFSQYMITGLLSAAAAVSLIGFCNYLGYDPLSVYSVFDAESDFLSTMGNINTLSAYLGLFIPFGMTLFCVSREKRSKFVYGAFCLCGFFGMIAANSDSAYLTVGAAFILLLWWSGKKYAGKYFAILILEYASANCAAGLFRQIRGESNCMTLRAGLPRFLLDVRINICLLLLSLLILIFFHICEVQKKDAQKIWNHLRKGMVFIVAGMFVLLFIAVLYINLNWDKAEAREYLGGLYRYLYFSNSWGTKRLRIWKAALLMFWRMPFFKKMIGMGPAGFYSAARLYLTPAERQAFEQQGRLVDAHNVYLQSLIVFGILGVILFIGFFVSALCRFWQKGQTEYYMIAFAMLVIAFLLQAVVNNAHIYIDPLIFALTAIGINLCREKGEKGYGSV